jgi:hypothetical protein
VAGRALVRSQADWADRPNVSVAIAAVAACPSDLVSGPAVVPHSTRLPTHLFASGMTLEDFPHFVTSEGMARYNVHCVG